MFSFNKNKKKDKEGILMEMGFFKTEDGRTYVTVDLKVSKDAAITSANKHFKTSKDRLGCAYGWIKNETLYFNEIRGAKKCWLFWRKSNSEYKK